MSNLFGSGASGGFGSNNQQSSNTFGGFGGNQSKPNLFGSLNTNTTAAPSGGSLFGANNSTATSQAGGLFGASAKTSTAPQAGGLFGAGTAAPPASNLFGASTNTSTAPQAGGLFGAANTTSAPQGGSLFGGTQSGGGLFGNNNSKAQPVQGSGLFGASTQSQPQQQSAFGGFGKPIGTTAGGGLFGNSSTNQQNQQQGTGFGGGLFSNSGQNVQQQQQQHQQGPQQGSLFGQSQQNRIWTEQDMTPRQKSVIDQIELVYSKWNPQSPNTVFQTYLYNTVSVDAAPFYRPDPSDNEEKWEEALQKRPNPGAIPFIVKGFEQLGHRIVSQEEHLKVLHGRLYEINNGLTDLLRRHDLDVSTRVTECRRKHLRLSQKCLALATKVQVLRNRGYAMDSAEEELKKRLLVLEKSVLDPALNGRGEEIWARMVNVRERGRLLQAEFERAGRNLVGEQSQGIDEEVMKRAKKILEDYSSQLSHLSKELERIQKEYTEWEESKLSGSSFGRGR